VIKCYWHENVDENVEKCVFISNVQAVSKKMAKNKRGLLFDPPGYYFTEAMVNFFFIFGLMDIDILDFSRKQ